LTAVLQTAEKGGTAAMVARKVDDHNRLAGDGDNHGRKKFSYT
jgi:hypothetical protein